MILRSAGAKGERGEHAIVALCSCSSMSHVVRLAWYEGDPEWYLTVTLDYPAGFWKRLRRALLFVFRPQAVCRYGNASELVLGQDDAEEMLAWLALRIDGMKQAKVRP